MKLLPALDQTLQPPAPTAGAEWSDHGAGLAVLAKYAGALAVAHVDVAAERLKSVPSPWARLLLFEQALFSARHPAHSQVLSEWRGLLGGIGLGRYLGIEVSARPIDLSRADGITSALRTMAPAGDSETIWDRIALLYFDGHLVGGTSSRTLVFTGIRRLTSGRLPFQSAGRLIDPTQHYRGRGDKTSLALLAEWLAETIRSFEEGRRDLDGLLGNLPAGEGAELISRVQQLMGALRQWSTETDKAVRELGRPAGRLIEKLIPAPIGPAFPDSHPAHLAFSRLLQAEAAEAVGLENELQIAGAHKVVNPGATGRLMKDGHAYSGDIVLPRGMTRAVKDGRFVLPTDASAISASLPDLGEFFERKLIPVGEFARERAIALEAHGVAYLLPFRPEILKHLTVQELASWTHVSGQRATGLTVRLQVPLVASRFVVFEQRYTGGDVFDADQVAAPLITAWPDFESPGWDHYYYVERQTSRRGLELEPWSYSSPTTFREAAQGLRWVKLNRPAEAWSGTFMNSRGLLLTPRPRNVPSTDAAWDISVDFGSTHTRVFRSEVGAAGTAVTREVHFTPRARYLLGPDNSLPYNFFVSPDTVEGPDAESPSLIWMPLDRTPERGREADTWLPPDGVMYWGDLQKPPSTAGLRGNLKWHGEESQEKTAFHSYVSQLFLSIGAEAAAEGARVRSLITAYPSVLPSQLRHRHRMEWGELERFGVTVKTPRSESEALASFYVHEKGAAITASLIALDVGGSTTDLTLWFGNDHPVNDSVRLAGDLLSRIVASDGSARAAITAALRRPPFNWSGVRWEEADPAKNGLILNSILRRISQHPAYRRDRGILAKNLYDGPSSPGEGVIAYVSYLFATMSFLAGLMVRRLGAIRDRYDIRFAGKGSEFLHWLDALASGGSHALPAAFFRAGAGLDREPRVDTEIQIVPPGNDAKQEVGRGLLVPTAGTGATPDDRVTFVGETGFKTEAGVVQWDEALTLESLGRIRPPPQLALDELENLSTFVRTFESDAAGRKAANALGIKPAALNRDLRDRIHARLFDSQSAWKAVQNRDEQRLREVLLEPLFVTEAKVLLEVTTGHPGLLAR